MIRLEKKCLEKKSFQGDRIAERLKDKQIKERAS